ncbi:MAG: hypothetical protein NT015_16375 [Alphaproteobacteria bacterium]|nr:hypothetical protein [Alphaproteobacteria bacterium]
MTEEDLAGEIEAHIRKAIRLWVWSGYYDDAAVEEMLLDVLEDGVDVDAMYALIPEAFAAKADAENEWPEVTDCDRLNATFEALDARGVCALQNAGLTQSDGLSDVRDAAHARGMKRYQGYCFFHAQDIESALDGRGMYLAFGVFDRNGAKIAEIGQRVVAALREAGLAVDWDGDEKKRVSISMIEWRRRLQKKRARP